MSVHKRGNTYFVRYRDAAGKQHNKHFGPGKKGKEKAEEFDLEIKLAKKKKQEIILLSGSTMFLEELFELYIRDYVLTGKSKTQADNLKMVFKSKLLPKLPSKPVNELKYQHMMDLIENYLDKSQSTRNNYFDYLSAVFNWGIRHGYTEVNPLQHWKRKKVPPRDFEITLEELGQILKYSPPHLKLAINVGYYTGMRAGVTELLKLQWAQIDFERDIIHLYRSKTDTSSAIPIAKALRPILLRAKKKAQSDSVIEYRGRGVKRVSTALTSAMKKAGITKSFQLKDLRHMMATYSRKDGVQPEAVSSVLGHSDITTTYRIYYQAMDEEKRKAVDAVPRLSEDGCAVERCRKKRDRPKKKKKFKVTDIGYRIEED